jgi:hypothetical protein
LQASKSKAFSYIVVVGEGLYLSLLFLMKFLHNCEESVIFACFFIVIIEENEKLGISIFFEFYPLELSI